MGKEFDKKQTLLFTMKPLSFEKMGEKLIRVSCYLLGTGINRNYSNITKDAILKANSGLAHLPVVGHLIQDEDGSYYMGGHDIKIEKKGRDWSIEPLTVALGVVAGDKEFEFVTLTEFEGTEREQEREYLKVDMIIWNHMSPVFEAAYSKDVYFNHSIEIDEVDGVWDETNNFRIDSFEYDRACLLGLSDTWEKHVEPCFPESKVYPTEYSTEKDFNKQFALLMQEIQKCSAEAPSDEDTPALETEDNSAFNIDPPAQKDPEPEQHQKKEEDEPLGKKTNILFSDVYRRIKVLMSESTYRNDEADKHYEKYIVLSVVEANSTVVVLDRENYYAAYKVPYHATQTAEGLVVNLDFENKTDMVVGAVDATDAVFNVREEVGMVSKDISDHNVADYSSSRENELMAKLDEVTSSYGEAVIEIAELKKHLAVYESEKKQYMAQKHKEIIDTLIASKRDDMGKYSEFLEYCVAIDYSKSVEDVEKELKEIHYNFMLTTKPAGKRNFSAIETEVISAETGSESLIARYGEENAKYFQ